MKILPGLLFLYILTKPFYFWESGLPQVSDFILLVGIAVAFIVYKPKKINLILKKNMHFVLFLVFVMLINLLYSIYHSEISFNLRTLYYIFDMLGILLFTIVLDDNRNAKSILRKAFMLALIMQLIILVAGVGRYIAGYRYMGTFNDPNQFAYFCLLSYSFIYLLDGKDRLNIFNLIFLLITIFLIIKSSSTGMIAGVAIFIVLFAINIIKKIKSNLKKYMPKIIILSLAAMCVLAVVAINPNTHFSINNLVDTNVALRLNQKAERASGAGSISLWEERGYDKIAYHPQYTLFGAGEGKYDRFQDTYHQAELHATIPSILFCYGIIPTLLIVIWGYKKLKGLRLEELCVYIALLVESFTLVNSRQVLFWAIIILAEFLKHNNKEKQQDE